MLLHNTQGLFLCWASPDVLDIKSMSTSLAQWKSLQQLMGSACSMPCLYVPSLNKWNLQRSSHTLGQLLSWVCSSPSCTQLCLWREPWDLGAALKTSIVTAGMPISQLPNDESAGFLDRKCPIATKSKVSECQRAPLQTSIASSLFTHHLLF